MPGQLKTNAHFFLIVCRVIILTSFPDCLHTLSCCLHTLSCLHLFLLILFAQCWAVPMLYETCFSHFRGTCIYYFKSVWQLNCFICGTIMLLTVFITVFIVPFFSFWTTWVQNCGDLFDCLLVDFLQSFRWSKLSGPVNFPIHSLPTPPPPPTKIKHTHSQSCPSA